MKIVALFYLGEHKLVVQAMTVVSKLRKFGIDPTSEIGLICEVNQKGKWVQTTAFFGQIATTQHKLIACGGHEFDPERDLLVQLPIKDSAALTILTLIVNELHLFRFKTNLILAGDLMRIRIGQGEVFFEHIRRLQK